MFPSSAPVVQPRARAFSNFRPAFLSAQESFINISVPKIDKDYSLYRTYVIFRTLGLRHLVVVDVHNHVVGLITRKDVMPFKMQERLESLLEQTTTLSPDVEYVQALKVDEAKKSVDSGKGSVCSDKAPVTARLLGLGVCRQSVGDASFPAVGTSVSSGEKDEEARSVASADAAADAEVAGAFAASPPPVVVTISPPDDDDDDDDDDGGAQVVPGGPAAAADREEDGRDDDDAAVPVAVTASPPENDVADDRPASQRSS